MTAGLNSCKILRRKMFGEIQGWLNFSKRNKVSRKDAKSREGVKRFFSSDFSCDLGTSLSALAGNRQIPKTLVTKKSFCTYLPARLSLHMATINNPSAKSKSNKFFGEGLTFDDVLL